MRNVGLSFKPLSQITNGSNSDSFSANTVASPNSSDSFSFFKQMPNEITLSILKHLDARSYSQFSKVNRTLNALIKPSIKEEVIINNLDDFSKFADELVAASYPICQSINLSNFDGLSVSILQDILTTLAAKNLNDCSLILPTNISAEHFEILIIGKKYISELKLEQSARQVSDLESVALDNKTILNSIGKLNLKKLDLSTVNFASKNVYWVDKALAIFFENGLTEIVLNGSLFASKDFFIEDTTDQLGNLLSMIRSNLRNSNYHIPSIELLQRDARYHECPAIKVTLNRTTKPSGIMKICINNKNLLLIPYEDYLRNNDMNLPVTEVENKITDELDELQHTTASWRLRLPGFINISRETANNILWSYPEEASVCLFRLSSIPGTVVASLKKPFERKIGQFVIELDTLETIQNAVIAKGAAIATEKNDKSLKNSFDEIDLSKNRRITKRDKKYVKTLEFLSKYLSPQQIGIMQIEGVLDKFYITLGHIIFVAEDDA